MKDLGSKIAYWDGVGATKTFTHPVNVTWLAGMSRTARVLDYGCGYGRVMAELSEHGFSDVSGVDLSPALIARGRQLRPDLQFAVLESPPELPCDPESFDVVLLFAVLTCIPDDDAQRALVAELNRLLTPGGLLYVSDMVLQDDERNRNRYATNVDQFGTPYGVFATDDGAVCRHHDIAELHALLSDFDPVDVGQVGRHMDRTYLCPSHGAAQPHDASRPFRRPPPKFAAVAARRRLRLLHPTGRSAANISENPLSASSQLRNVWCTEERRWFGACMHTGRRRWLRASGPSPHECGAGPACARRMQPANPTQSPDPRARRYVRPASPS